MTKSLTYFRAYYGSISRKITLALFGVMGIHASALAQAPYSVAAHKGSQAQPLIFAANGSSTPKTPQSPNAPAWLWVSEKQGLILQTMPTVENTSLPAAATLVKGEFELLAFSDPYVLTLDRRADRIRPIMLKQIAGKVATNMLPLLPMTQFEINWICIQPRLQDGNIYAWFGGEDGYSEQWLLGDAGHFVPQKLRSQAIPVNSTSCAIDGDTLLVSEPEAGVWQFDASPFADNSAKLILASLDNDITGMQVIDGKLLLSNKKGELTLDKQAIANYDLGKVQGLSGYLSENNTSTTIQFALYDDKTDQYLLTKMRLPAAPNTSQTKPQDQIVEIPAWVESAPSDRPGDTMDDPAIWVHPTQPEQSLVLGTNKRWGLLSFNMRGEQMQALPSGRINNVDLRQQVMLGGKKRDIAVATLRDNDSLAFYEINPQGKIVEYPNQATDLVDIYGMCLYQDADNLYVFANEKSGRIAQYRVDWQANGPSIQLLRDIHTPSQVEGCVVDEAQHALFIGEEDKGIWRFNAKANGDTQGELIIKAEGDLVPDVEGIALYLGAQIQGKKQDLLVVSSQGNNSYLLYQTKPPYAQVGRFRIGVNMSGVENGRETSIDGSSETDGLAVTHLAVGKGAWQQGMLVVQDGHNHLPDNNQSFKWLPWSSIVEKISLH
ncbi:phytase [Shewanella sp. CG12_big_fil_rev_8_21_14_0_65_47_15]|uniref:phytase n=1 Tax=Shewanella sp. CG12_big_fil_rev_8_21_14_0_65_47_15 TaxID=1975537 RepID=UPI000CAF75C3|nr:phytase [Shewanella sp. CG12_big_fil_rev_8_21_14_0_65_47_15]PIW60581.1 MAG: phytase [Shewanella sp. CG12_big_fil_rev_8_21_14_0_65_47_15]